MDFPICEKQIKSRVLSEAAGETGLFRTINVGHNIRRQHWSREQIKAYLTPFFFYTYVGDIIFRRQIYIKKYEGSNLPHGF